MNEEINIGTTKYKEVPIQKIIIKESSRKKASSKQRRKLEADIKNKRLNFNNQSNLQKKMM